MTQQDTSSSAQHDAFRLDINGLRAWAVTAVVLYHFGIPGFSGGFAGVDVFFVISGFLMAGIVVGGLEKQRFKLFDFYMARARRIVPALLIVVLVVLVVGAVILMPGDFKQMGRHARDSLFFMSNLRYLKESGYFDVASHEKWFLHTWSLSVEWQFYLIYPLILAVVYRFLPQRRLLLALHGIALLASFSLAVYWVGSKSELAFYLLQARAWELLLGGLVFFASTASWPESRRRNSEWLGLGLILASIVMIDSQQPWPGALALPATLGAALVLLARRRRSLGTGTGLAQWIGLRSYSIYLWHWPLAVGLVYFNLQKEWLWVGAAIAAALLLSNFSYRWIETPSRRWLAQRSNLRALAWLLLPIVIVAGFAQAARRDGLPQRLPEKIATVTAERDNTNPRQDECLDSQARCVFGGNEIQAIVVGDSHADSIVTAIQDSLPDPLRQGLAFRAAGGCLLVENVLWVQGKREDCQQLNAAVFQELDQQLPGKPLILINRLTAYALGDASNMIPDAASSPMVYFSRKPKTADADFLAEFREHYLESTCKLAQKRVVYALLPVPDLPVDVPKAMGKALMRNLPADISITLEAYHARHDFARNLMQEAAQKCGIKLLDPMPHLCDTQHCYGSREGFPLYVDDDHLSMHGNRLLMPLFAPIFQGSPDISGVKE